MSLSLSKDWVAPEKFHTPTTDGILEILTGGGVKDSGNPGRRGGGGGGLNTKKSSAGAISTNCLRDSNVLSLVTLQHFQTLKIVEIFCSHISHLT